MKSFRFIDLFAGIGGIRMALESVGGTCVFSSEKDKFARITYKENFGEEPHGDIYDVNVTDIPDHEVLAGGFPCQPFSIAGVSKKKSLGREHGFRDRTQGTLFFKIAEILEARRPRAFLLENVKNLLSHDQGRTFQIIRETFEELGYTLFHKVLDAQGYVPQHRERIFLVGFDSNVYPAPVFSFPDPPQQIVQLKSILEKSVHQKYTLSAHLWKWHQDYAAKHKKNGNGFGYGLVNGDSVARTLSARYYKDGAEILVSQNPVPRRLTPRECARLMGFPDSFRIAVSDTQAYKQFGNSVAVPLVTAVARSLSRAL
ncbi:MAG TPA: DNA (cytosine-5-)-methyltransferase [Leptospiraceae bacterium]|nr:DNA (cytosine-5-)-methyltransferase [Leptospiraceae bacterium]HNE21651.1 DNA (cytosine-5-)-methyltransferase [Leptospiraceae bacterium]HNJ33670.1 DNA (cytosine-5-)-methyltransferase [Leptospiraceae bacterium]